MAFERALEILQKRLDYFLRHDRYSIVDLVLSCELCRLSLILTIGTCSHFDISDSGSRPELEECLAGGTNSADHPIIAYRQFNAHVYCVTHDWNLTSNKFRLTIELIGERFCRAG